MPREDDDAEVTYIHPIEEEGRAQSRLQNALATAVVMALAVTFFGLLFRLNVWLWLGR